MTQDFLHIVNEECGYRGMQVFLETLRGKISEADQGNIAFFCPTIGLLDVNHPIVSDFSGLVITEGGVVGKKIRIPKSTQAWLIKQVEKSLGKKVGKMLSSLLSSCDIPSGFGWWLVGNLPFGVGEFLIPCIVYSN